MEPFEPDFSPGSRTVACSLDGSQTGREPDRDFYIACNAWVEALPFRLPPSPSGKRWRRTIDEIRNARTQEYAMYAVAVRGLLELAQPGVVTRP